MANTFTTTNMMMILPTVSVQLGPQWAEDLNVALSNNIDAHDHTSGKGVKIPTAGLNINDDLDLQTNDLINLRSSQYINSVSTIPDVRSIYVSSGNLYYNNNAGTPIQITSGSNINVGALNLNIWDYLNVNSNLTLTSGDAEVYLAVDTSAARTINLPAANTLTAGRYFVIKDRSGTSSSNNITISPAGSDTINTQAISEIVNYDYGSLILICDGVSNWNTFREGSPGATAGASGVVRLAGDLAGAGSTYTSPRVVDATNLIKGKLQLSGDLQGDSSSASAPRINNIAGAGNIATVNTVASASFKFRSLYSNDIIGVNAAGSSAQQEVQIGDAQHLTNIKSGVRYENAVTLTATGMYQLDSIQKNHIVFVYSTLSLILVLPQNQPQGRSIIIKDISGLADSGINNINVITLDGKKIEGSTLSRKLETNYGTWQFVADANGDWWIL